MRYLRYPLKFVPANNCSPKVNPTTKIQKLLNGGFSNLDGIDMGRKGYFLRLLHLMSCKNKERQC